MATEKELKVNVEDVFERYEYDPCTGQITWRDLPNMTHKKPSQLPGMPAFTTMERKGYMNGSVRGYLLKAHRVAWLLHYGSWPKAQIDHINGVPWDNRISNLRECTNSSNCKNRNMNKSNTSGWTGVKFNSRAGRWTAAFRLDYKHIHVGFFNCPTIAHFAILRERLKYGYSNSHGARGRVSITNLAPPK